MARPEEEHRPQDEQTSYVPNTLKYGDSIVLGGQYMKDTPHSIYVLMGSNRKDPESAAKSKTIILSYQTVEEEPGISHARWVLTDPEQHDYRKVLQDDTVLKIGRRNRELFPNENTHPHSFVSHQHALIVTIGECVAIAQFGQENPTYLASPNRSVMNVARRHPPQK